MGKKPAVSLRVYKGQKMSYDEKGKVQNENQRVVLTHDTVQWKNFLKSLRANGYIRVEAEKIFYVEPKKDADGYFKDEISECPEALVESIKAEIANAFEDKKPELTDDQRRIAELEEKINKMMNGTPKKEPKIKEVEVVAEVVEGESLRDTYIREVGKKPFGGWDDAKVQAKLDEFRASN